jgi:divalent metal cation (Fe/Co/Zn/Cd) transporter
MKYHVDLHAIVNAMITVKEGHDLAHKDTGCIKNFLNWDTLIHVEPEE